MRDATYQAIGQAIEAKNNWGSRSQENKTFKAVGAVIVLALIFGFVLGTYAFYAT